MTRRFIDGDRGQLILAGAVVFSLVLIGIVVVFSTTLYTANLGSGSAHSGLTEGSAVESDVERAAEELIEKINDDSSYGDLADRETAFEESIEYYDGQVSDRTADSGPVIVAVEVDSITGDGGGEIESAELTVIYETRSVTTERTIEVDA